MKRVVFVLSIFMTLLHTKTIAQTKDILVKTDASLCGSVEMLFYAIDPVKCTIIESNWLAFAPGANTRILVSSPIWPLSVPSSTSIIEAVAVRSCRGTIPLRPKTCANVDFVKVGNASNTCGAFTTILLRDCFEDSGSCGTCATNTVFNVKYSHVNPTSLEVEVY